MSVPKYDRSEGKLQVAVKARQLAYTVLTGLKSEKHIPKSQRWIIGSDLKNDALDVYRYIRKANRINVKTYEDYTKRRDYMIEAQNSLEALEADINLAIDLGYLKDLSMDYWQELIDETSKLLIAWRKGDRKSYAEIISDAKIFQEQNVMHQIVHELARLNDFLLKQQIA